MSHTPGPWKVDAWKDGRIDVVSDHSDMTVGEVTTRVHVESPPDMLEYQEHQANAHLIAAAPEMLEALEAVADWQAYYEDDRDLRSPDGLELKQNALSLCKSALEKARGVSHPD